MGAVKLLLTLLVTTVSSVVSCGITLLITSVLYFIIPEQIKTLESMLGFSYLAVVAMVLFPVLVTTGYAAAMRIFYSNV